MAGGFVLLTIWAAPNKLDDSFVHLWLLEVFLYELDSIVLPHVSGYLCVMF